MIVDVVMPQLGESVVEGTVVKWLVKPGDRVAKDQALLEISTDKVDAEIPSPEAGVVAELLAKTGEVVPIKAVIARIETEAATGAWDEEKEGMPSWIARKGEAMPPIPAAPAVPTPATPPLSRPPASGASTLRITPVVARMAAEHGLDLSKIAGSGIDGRVTKRDVEAFLAGGGVSSVSLSAASAVPGAAVPGAAAMRDAQAPPAAASHATPPASGAEGIAEGDQVIPFSPIRKMIAERMVRSKQTSPHVHAVAEVDMHRIMALRAGFKQQGRSVTVLPFLLIAAVRALAEFPTLNAIVSGESLIIRKAVHLGVAVETERGLMVPVVRDAEKLSLGALSDAVDDLAARARNHRILPDELNGGTFSVSNPGPKGNLFGTPIINQPQVGILRMGQVVKRPVVSEVDGADSIVIRPMMYLVLGYDHRVVDGVAGNGFLFRVREILEAGEFSL
ncbi:MAG TPA: dihydrolipoamide acetyltransferase family protein [Candidatus Deferrimicrobiaceae bacterium]|jgi:2-oxoglutarate dehydrogenase E2 component (dihydrolipoamide succinyltransferase)